MRIVTGLVAEWSCSGLQIRVRRFDSDPGLHVVPADAARAAAAHDPRARDPFASELAATSLRVRECVRKVCSRDAYASAVDRP